MSALLDIPRWIEKHERRLLVMGITELSAPKKECSLRAKIAQLRREVERLRVIVRLAKRYMEASPGEKATALLDELVDKVYQRSNVARFR